MWTGPIERSLFGFIWKYSKRDQLILLVVTLTLFPLLYLTLELPKQIINDAIGSGTPTVSAYGYEFDQITYLMILCGGFLVAVLCHGLLKMRINTMKGVLAERLLRRFRYTLIARILRFPQPYFERTSQGELVSMVTAESEPMGGLMGDAIAQPVLQAGQMLTILGFLFFQSLAFGFAAIALIPLQAWLIPKLQRQINLLNKKRVIQVRALAAEIGEGAAGAGTLRVNGGWRYRMAMIGNRLGNLFSIRFEIYQKKFFMKFLNNFITQLTPFFFFSIGGYLVIQGDVTIGALVAALAAYKDLSSPWKELLAYYNQVADMSLRWETITERFAPSGMIDDELFYGPAPDDAPRLNGDIVLDQVTVSDGDGNAVLEDISLTVPAGTSLGITAPNDEDRRALAEVLIRETLPTSGGVRVAGEDLRALHQTVIAKRIGHVTSRPIMFQGSYGQNVMMPMRLAPAAPAQETDFSREAVRAGNSADMLEAQWLDPGLAGLLDKEALRAWWYTLIEGSGCAEVLTRRTMDQTFDPEAHPELTQALIDLRPQIAAAVAEAGLERYVYRFDPDSYNPALPIAENLFLATPKEALTPELIKSKLDFLRLLHDLSLASNLERLARNIIEMLRQIFGATGTDHPLFRKLGLEAEVYEAALDLVGRKPEGSKITDEELALLLSVPSNVTAEQVSAAFPDDVRQRVLDMRAAHADTLLAQMDDLFVPIRPDAHVYGLSVLENALYGKLSDSAGTRGDDLRRIVVDVLTEAGVNQLVLELVFDVPIAIGGANLPALFAEPLSISRATIKRPDILILDEPMASYGEETRAALIRNLRELLPEATLIFLGTGFDDEDAFDAHVEVVQGRLQGAEGERAEAGSDASADLARKVEALRQAPMFSGLKRKQLRLLAFGARWYHARPDEYVFHKNDAPTDGAYIVTEGQADLLLPQDAEADLLIATVEPGALVGELGLIRSEPRALDMRAKTELTCLRIGEEEFMAVVENDAATAFRLLQVVAGYVKT
ncbi:MAG: ABC transporter transmembrane domain-containing protein [Pseudomonadota bacterium]